MRRWRAVAAVAFALAVAVKFLPIVLLPLYWRRVRIRDALLAAIVFVLLYVPFLNHGRIPIGSLGTYIQSFRFNDPVFAGAASEWRSPQLVVALAVLVGLSYGDLVQSQVSDACLPDAFAWPMAASLLCRAALLSVVSALAAAVRAIDSTLPIIIWTVSIIPTYIVWHLRAAGRSMDTSGLGDAAGVWSGRC